MPPAPHASLLAALLDMQPGEPHVIAAPAPPVAGRGRRGPMRLVAVLARLVLRYPRAKRLGLALLGRFPRLHARAMAVLFAPSRLIDLDPVPLDAGVAASLTPRARLAARRATLGQAGTQPPRARRRLAFVSPLPPERTGIADYAAQLLPALMEHCDIVLIVQQDTVALPFTLPIHDAAWLREHAHTFDDILYQIGNSEFHSHMFALLRDHPGVVVLHDFFLGNVMAYRQMRGDPPGAWTGALFHAHGYPALRAYSEAPDRAALLKTWPCNLAVLEQATAVIHHSRHAAVLAEGWYGPDATRNWHAVPLPRAAPPDMHRAAARAALGIAADAFLVCSFGYVTPNKLGDRLLAAWMASALQQDARCLLVLVGANQDSPFGAGVAKMAAASAGRIRIAGWSDDAVYRQYLQAADMGVQLRTSAQGETSAAVLDCMNYGLATIVNANGSMAGLPDDAILRLPDTFADADLVAALETLHRDTTRRIALGRRAAQLLETGYRPHRAAALYAAALREPGPNTVHVRQLLVDIGDGHHADDLRALLATTQVRVEPVRLVLEAGQWRLRYARQYAASVLGLAWAAPDDPLVDLADGDILYCPAATAATTAAGAAGLWRQLRGHGIRLALGWPDQGADLLVRRNEFYNSGC